MEQSSSLKQIAKNLVVSGKGLLAVDESIPTMGKRFAPHGVENNLENRQAYRENILSTQGFSQYISGTILFDETLRQKTQNGIPMAEFLGGKGIIPGIKVDRGLKDFPEFPGEKYTQGLDELATRLDEYRDLGAKFTKWRAVITIGEGIPTLTTIETSARSLAMFAALSQAAGLVPVVEPEVLMTGTHTLERYEAVSTITLKTVFGLLADHRVELEGMLLKTGMVLSGDSCNIQADTDSIATATLRCLRRTVPAAVPGILFLSGGQSETEATRNLNAICRPGGAPWALSISFGRALQATALATWKGKPENGGAAQSALLNRARLNSLAMLGKYSADSEGESP
jgi:fructose-bisphosphate aldolase class I